MKNRGEKQIEKGLRNQQTKQRYERKRKRNSPCYPCEGKEREKKRDETRGEKLRERGEDRGVSVIIYRQWSERK